MKKFKCLLLTLLLIGGSVMAQKRTITGKVLNQVTGDPLPDVNILGEKQKGGVITKNDGTFSITVENATGQLIFSYTGFATQTISIAGKQVINVSLVPSITDMNDVIVIGYGTQKKSHLTGAIAKYKNDRIDETSVVRLDQALQGRIAGVQVQNINPESGADPKINIRGVTSLGASTSPLVVVDGQVVPDGLAFVNMSDVESVEVLKDAASAAIYGSRGSAGVIMITTKKGKAEKTKFAFKYSQGLKDPYKLYSMMSVTDYTKMLYDEAALRYADSAAYTVGFTSAQRTTFGNNKGNLITTAERAAYVLENTITGVTDWQDESLRTGVNKNIQLSAAGGSKSVQYFISGAYQRDEGMMYHSDYQKYNLRTRLDAQLSKRLKVSVNINPSYSKRERPSVNFTDFYRFLSYIPIYHNATTAAFVNQVSQWANIKAGDFAQARHFNGRVYSGLMPDGSNWVNTVAQDPFATANNQPKSIMETRTINNDEYRMQSSADLTFNILPGLDFKTQASTYINYTTGLDFAKRNSTGDGVANTGIYTNRTTISLYSENTFTYNKTIKQHAITALAGFTAEKNTFKDEKITGSDYPDDNFTTLNNALLVNKDSTYNKRIQDGLLSYLGRVNYSFADKYLLSASLRYDGSSKFGESHKWGLFPAISAGWVLTEERFLSNKISWLDRLKLRASYGLTGNNRISDYGFVDLLYSGNYAFGSGNGTSTSGQVTSTSLIANPLIAWERTYQTNLGVDVALLKSKITLGIDIYRSHTDKLLIQQSAMIFTGAPVYNNNNGSFRNTGIEVELSTVNIEKRHFRWTTSANFSHNKNKVIELGKEAFLLNQGERTELYLNKAGNPLIEFFGFRTDGVWLSQTEIDAAKAKGLNSALSNVFVPGGLKLVDITGDNIIDNNDRTQIGSPYPDFTWGLTNMLTYKAFDLSFTFQGVQGGSLINGDPNYNESKRYNRSYNTNRWISPNNPGDGKTPYSTIGFNWMLTDYVVEDASYYALREILLGYKIPGSISKAIGLGSVRFYASAQNVFFHNAEKYRGLNPEARTTSGPYASVLIDGYQRGAFPTSRSFLFGIDINF